LGLKPGEGLVVNFVSPDSPAAKADVKKNDVLVDFEGQMLVDPIQLRKLVRMHAEGDTVKLTFYRGGKKQTVSAKLAKTTLASASMEDDAMGGGLHKFQFRMHDGDNSGLHADLEKLAAEMAHSGASRDKVNVEVQRTIEQTRKAIEKAVKHSPDAHLRVLKSVDGNLHALAGAGVDVSNDATVVVKNDKKSIKTMVKTDDGASYVLIADPAKHLTVHDKDGKLVFDGPCEKPEEQQKVPKEIMEKVRTMIDELGETKVETHDSQPDTQEKPKI